MEFAFRGKAVSKAGAHRRLGIALFVGSVLCMATHTTRAAVPSAKKIAEAVAEANRLTGRAVPILMDLTLSFDRGDPVATGVLASHPTGLARLELRSRKGFIERHLLQGNLYTASRDGREFVPTRPFLPPLFFLQAISGAALEAALTSYGVAPGEAVLGRVGDRPQSGLVAPQARREVRSGVA